jgi:hypothetical protein
MNQIINISAFAILTLLWLGFGAALLFHRELLDKVWQSFRRLPLVIQIGLSLLLLPVVLGLWIWNAKWPLWLRLVLVIGLAWVTITTFFPQVPLA